MGLQDLIFEVFQSLPVPVALICVGVIFAVTAVLALQSRPRATAALGALFAVVLIGLGVYLFLRPLPPPGIPAIALDPCNVTKSGRVFFPGKVRRNGYSGKVTARLVYETPSGELYTRDQASGIGPDDLVYTFELGDIGDVTLPLYRIIVDLDDRDTRLTRRLRECSQ